MNATTIETIKDIFAWSVFVGGSGSFLFAVFMLIHDTTDSYQWGDRIAENYRRAEETRKKIPQISTPENVARYTRYTPNHPADQ
jgi:hypothetical protein